MTVPAPCDSETTNATGTRRRPPFAMVPEALLYDERVTPFAVRLYGALDRYLGPREVAWPGYELLRSKLAYVEPSTGRRREPSDEALGNAVGVLEAAGWLIVERSKGRSNRYRLLDRPRPQAGDEPGDGKPSTTRASAGTPNPQPPAPARPDHPRQRGSRESQEREELPPTPTGSAAGDPPPSSDHRGQHANCRACGTNRRGVRPPDPELAAAEARRRHLAAGNEQVRAVLTAPDVLPADSSAHRAASLRAALRGDGDTGTS